MRRVTWIKRQAREACSENGHSMARFTADRRYGGSVHHAICGKCRCHVTVADHSLWSDVPLSGNALTVSCN